jgi:hypothetical protein
MKSKLSPSIEKKLKELVDKLVFGIYPVKRDKAIGWIYGEDDYKNLKAFLAEELANQKKEMIERIEKIKGKRKTMSQWIYNQAIDDIIQAIK